MCFIGGLSRTKHLNLQNSGQSCFKILLLIIQSFLLRVSSTHSPLATGVSQNLYIV